MAIEGSMRGEFSGASGLGGARLDGRLRAETKFSCCRFELVFLRELSRGL